LTGISRERWPLILGLSAVPASIAVSEFLLYVAALVQLIRLFRRQIRLRLPSCLWFWLAWAALELLMWARSPEPTLAESEMRHLLLVGVLLMTLSGFDRPQDLLAAWKGIFLTATFSSAVLIGQFFFRLNFYRDEIAAGGDATFYLRSGGLLHHWMIYGTVEIVVMAGLIAFWSSYPNQRRRLLPIVIINATAVVLSLTRMAWITCMLLVGIHLIWKRSRWIWALPVVPLIVYAIAPVAVSSRASDFIDVNHYSNAERLQMLNVGWKMLRDHPFTGVGPGRVEKLYESYLAPQDPIPAYHGHLHNNVVQIAAQFGILVTLAAVLFVLVAFRDLLRARRAADDTDRRFLSDTAVLGLTGFVFAGLFEYTYGHSLGLIIITFATLPALLTRAPVRVPLPGSWDTSAVLRPASEITTRSR
jgi:O-antigen ligase